MEEEAPRLTTYLDLEGDGFDPNEVTVVLGIKPDSTWRRGEPFKGMRPRKHDRWSLKIGGEPSWSFEDQLNELFALMRPKLGPLAELRKRLNAKVHITCVAVGGIPAIYFDQGMVARAAELGAAIEVDVIHSTAEENAEFDKWPDQSGQSDTSARA